MAPVPVGLLGDQEWISIGAGDYLSILKNDCQLDTCIWRLLQRTLQLSKGSLQGEEWAAVEREASEMQNQELFYS